LWRVTIKTIQDKALAECTKCHGAGKLNWLDNMMGGGRYVDERPWLGIF